MSYACVASADTSRHILCTSGEVVGTAAAPSTQLLLYIIQREKFMINALMELPSDVASNLDAAD